MIGATLNALNTFSALNVRLPKPHAGQRVVLSSRARFKWLAAGRRWRKTTLALHPAIEGALDGQDILWGAPTYDQCRTGWEELQHAARHAAVFHETHMEARFPGGGRILFRSLDDPDNARSKTANGFIMDEAAFCHPDAWPEVIRPLLSDTGGWALILSTPHGRNWFWEEWVAAQSHPSSAAWSAPTLGVEIENGELVRRPHPMENPEFSFAEACDLFSRLPERIFRQEFLAEFTDTAGAQAFRRTDFRYFSDVVLDDDIFYHLHRPDGMKVVAARDLHTFITVDLAASLKTSADYFVASVWGVTPDRELLWLDMIRGRYEGPAQLSLLVNLAQRWRPGFVAIESNAYQLAMVQSAIQQGLPARPVRTHKDKLTRSMPAQMRVAAGTVYLRAQASWVRHVEDELVAFPHGAHDDIVDTLSIAAASLMMSVDAAWVL